MMEAPSPHSAALRKPWRRRAGWAVVLLVLLAVFALYQRPDFLVMLADQAWSCF